MIRVEGKENRRNRYITTNMSELNDRELYRNRLENSLKCTVERIEKRILKISEERERRRERTKRLWEEKRIKLQLVLQRP